MSAALGSFSPAAQPRTRGWALEELAQRRAVSSRLWDRDATLWKSGARARPLVIEATPWAGSVSATTCAPAGRAGGLRGPTARGWLHQCRSARHGRLEPRSRGMRWSSACPEGYPDLPSSTPPTRRRSSPSRPRGPLMHALHRLQQVRGTTGARASTLLLRPRQGGGRGAGRQHFVAVTDRGHVVRQEVARPGFRACSSTRATSAAATRRSRSSASSRRRSWAWIWTGARRGAREAGRAAGRPGAATRARAAGRGDGRGRGRGRDKLTLAAEPPATVRRLESSSSSPRAPARRARVSCRSRASRWAPGVYGEDRLFVDLGLRRRGDGLARRLMDLAAAGPRSPARLRDEYDLGGEFLRWEIAMATAGRVIGIDPFDQPNVQESKDNTKRLLEGYTRAARCPRTCRRAGTPGLRRTTRGYRRPADCWHKRRRAITWPQAYVATGSRPPKTSCTRPRRLRKQARVTTTAGYGPSFLHSTGQYHKGGPNTGVVHTARGRRHAGRPHTGAALFVRDAEAGAGRASAQPALARAARPARGTGRRSDRRPAHGKRHAGRWGKASHPGCNCRASNRRAEA